MKDLYNDYDILMYVRSEDKDVFNVQGLQSKITMRFAS